MNSGPYRSKVLNFISNKYRQILDRSDRAFSHLKFVATNTVQLLLYPIYVLIQTSRLTVKQIQNKVAKKAPKITVKVNNKISPNYQTTDKQLKQISPKTIQTTTILLPLQPSVNLSNPKLFIKPQPKVFSLLNWEQKSISNTDIAVENKDVVIDNHQKLELLTREKQKPALILETANSRKQVQLQLQPCTELVPILGPLGGFWQIMAWLQTSKVALWFNLFNERNQEKTTVTYQTIPLLSSSNLTFSEFTHNIAKRYLYPITKGLGLNGLLPPFNQELLLESDLEDELAQQTQNRHSGTLASVVSLFQPETFEIAVSLPTSITPEKIGKLGKGKTGAKDRNQKNFLVHEQPTQKIISTSNNFSKIEVNRLRENRGKSSRALTQIDRDRNEENVPATIKNSQIYAQSYTLESKSKHPPDCLEVDSVSIGYVKHPLEEILGWVDVIMTRLERVFTQVWQWCQKKLESF